MGTNFYWMGYRGDESAESWDNWSSPQWHIGRRSAAGLFCYDCGESLIEGGARNVHTGKRALAACPQCGGEPQKDRHSGVLVELGFQEPAEKKLTGVQGVSSFSWAQEPIDVIKRCLASSNEECIEDEYGDHYTGQQFLQMLRINCPIRFTDSIGRIFS